jgi:hypothetical protein
MNRRRREGRGRSGGPAYAVGATFLSVAALVAFACSNTASNEEGGGDASVSADAACPSPFPESLSVSGQSDCVAVVPDPCCAGFNAFACAGDAGGSQCSETSTCVRAARYDQSLCAGAEAYSCPVLNGQNYATLTTPACEQMETAGPAGEGIRWCCGSNLPPVNLDAGQPPPPPSDDAGGPPPSGDSGMPPPKDSGAPPQDSGTAPPKDAGPPPSDDAGAPPVDSGAPKDAGAE